MKSVFLVATMLKNALATIAVAKLRGIDNQTIKEVLSAFGGVKHRLQYVGQVNEVSFFYNDSKLPISWQPESLVWF